jgi:hypothetical protein
VLLVVRNGAGLPSNPVFVGFYWPEPDELSNYTSARPRGNRIGDKKVYPVMKNLRPTMDLGLTDDTFWCRPGQAVRFEIKAEDPEGYPVTLYRRTGEPGRLAGNVFTMQAGAEESVETVHFVASDGTGGYAGRRAKIVVAAEPPAAAAPWRPVLVGVPPAGGSMRMEDGTLRMTAAGNGLHGGGNQDGLMAAVPLREGLDIVCRVGELSAEGGKGPVQAGLVAYESLYDFSPYLAGYVQSEDGKRRARGGVRPNMSRWARNTTDARVEGADRLRLRCLGGRVAAYASEDGAVWEQLAENGLKPGPESVAGVALSAGPSRPPKPEARARLACTPEIVSDSLVPILAVEDVKRRKRLNKDEPALMLRILAPEGAAVRYTLDGTEPGEQSAAYAEPVAMEKRPAEIRARAWRDGRAGPVVVLHAPKTEKK